MDARWIESRPKIDFLKGKNSLVIKSIFGRDSGYFFLPVLSLTVVLGCRCTVDCLTNLPVEALRPRLPPDLFPAIAGLLPVEGAESTRFDAC